MPLPVALKLPPMLLAPSKRAMLFVMLALLIFVLFSETAPVNALLLPLVERSIALLPALKLEVPVTVNAPVWLMPLPFAVKLPPMLLAPNARAMPLVIVAL